MRERRDGRRMNRGSLSVFTTLTLSALAACGGTENGNTNQDASVDILDQDRDSVADRSNPPESGGKGGAGGQDGTSGSGGAAGAKGDASDSGASGSAGRADANGDAIDAARSDRTTVDVDDRDVNGGADGKGDTGADRSPDTSIDGEGASDVVEDSATDANATGDGTTMNDANASDVGAGDVDPFAMRGAVSGHMAQPTAGMDICSAGVHWVNAPYPPRNTQTQQVSESTFAQMAVDGSGGQTVSCVVRASGATFAVTIDISSPASDGDGTQLSPTHFHAQIPSVGDKETAASGSIAIQDNMGVFTYAGNCTFSVAPMDATSLLGVSSGRIWARFQCDNINEPKNPGTSCSVDVGFLVFENCKTQ